MLYRLYMESKKMIQMKLFTKQKQTHRYRRQLMVTKGERGGVKLGVWDSNIHTTIYKIDNQQGPSV